MKIPKRLSCLLLLLALPLRGDVVTSVVSPLGGGGGAAGAVTPGTTTVTGCQNRVLYGDNSSVLNCEAALGYTASTDTLNSTGVIAIADGTAAAPSLALASDIDGAGTGFFRSAANAVGFSANGAATMILTASNFTMNTGDTITLGQVSANRQWMELYLSRGTLGSKTKALTESAATEFVRVAVPQTAGSNFAGGKAIWTVYATDATNNQSLSGESRFTAVNTAGTETCGTIGDTQTGTAASSGTLTCTITCVTGLTDQVGLAANCVSSLTQTTLDILWRLDMPKVNTITPQ